MAITTSNGQHNGVAPDINVTPLVDVVLVLLIIFMVVTPQLENDVQVNLPSILNVDPDSQQEYEAIAVSISRDGAYFIDDTAYELDALKAELQARLKVDPRAKLSLRADVAHGFGDVRELFAALKDSGFKGAALVVSENKGGGNAGAAATARPQLRGDDAKP